MKHLVERPCVVEAVDGVVIVECGTAATTLTGEVAEQAGKALQREGAKAQAQSRSDPADV